MEHANHDSPRRGSFLPDFCALPMVFGVVVLSELFAIVLVLAGSPWEQTWNDLALISLFVQWVGLSGTACLCLLRRPLERLSDVAAATASYLILLLLIVLVSEGAYHLLLDQLPGAPSVHLEFVARNLAIGAIVSGIILRYFWVRQQWRLQVQAESEARFEALQARIRPHFLFNSLNTAASLTHDRPDLAERALEDLADLFRASLADSRKLITFSEELELTRGYLAIEQLRLGERLKVVWALDDIPNGWPLPPLVLQPLVENAVHHGIEPNPQGGTIAIAGRCGKGFIELDVTNPEPAAGESHAAGNRMALDNIRQRLAARFGDDARLGVGQMGGMYRARLRIPKRSEA